MGKRLSMGTWENIFRNTQESGEDIEIQWLDGSDEWCLCCGEELFEDGYKTEQEAQERLDHLEGVFLRGDISSIQRELAREASKKLRQEAPWILGGDE